MSFERDLNILGKSLFEAAVQPNYAPVDLIGLDVNCFTMWHSDSDDAFLLNPPIAGMLKDARTYPGLDVIPDGDRFLLRSVLGYAAGARALSDSAMGTLIIANLINNMIMSAYKVYGPRIRRLTFARPGSQHVYFRELEHNAAFEVRLYGELTPVEQPLEREVADGTINGI